MASSIRIAILANASQARRELNGISKDASGFGDKMASFGKFAAKGVAVVGVAAAAAGIAVTKSASDAQQSLGATETVFGKYASTVIATSKKASGAYGLSANEYRTSANLIGSLFKNQGVSAEKLAGVTDKLVAKGADLSATFGGTAADAVESLSSAYKGEFDPLEKYGISIKQSTVNTEAMAVANVKSQSAFNKLSTAQQTAAKQQATTNLINKQSAASAGAFAKESNTLANRQQVLAAKFEDVKVVIGNYLLPIATSFFNFLSTTALPVVQSLGQSLIENLKTAFEKVQVAITAMQPIFEAVMGFIKDNPDVVKAFAIAVGVLTTAVVLWTAAQTALNFVLTANPIGVIILAIAALVAGVVYAYQRFETFRNIVNAVWSFLSTAIPAAVVAIKNAVVAAFNFLVGFVQNPMATIKSVVSGAWTFIKNAVVNALNALGQAVISKFNSVVGSLVGFKNRVIGFFGAAAGWLVNAGRNIVTGAIRGIAGLLGSAGSKVAEIKGRAVSAVAAAASWLIGAGRNIINGLLNGIGSVLGSIGGKLNGAYTAVTQFFAAAPSWLLNAGRQIIDGFISGIQAGFQRVKDLLQSLTNLLPDWKGPPKRDKVLLKGAGQTIIQGLITGLEDKFPAVRQSLKGLTKDIGGFGADLSPGITLDARGALAGQSALAGAGVTYQINVTAPVGSSSVDIGRDLTKHIEKYEQTMGRVRK